MTPRTLRYSAGNENSPTDPWGRSELVIQPGGRARLDHHFSRGRGTRVWAGQVDTGTLSALWAALTRSGFPVVPRLQLVPDATVRQLMVEAAGLSQQVSIEDSQSRLLPGYREVFGILDGVIGQLSRGAAPRSRS
ncbi:MAG: hypothetical protein ABJB47_11575 [Actinomycetota bacterium]